MGLSTNLSVYKQWFDKQENENIQLDYKDIKEINFYSIDKENIEDVYRIIDSMLFFINVYLKDVEKNLQKTYISDFKKIITSQDVFYENSLLIKKSFSTNGISDTIEDPNYAVPLKVNKEDMFNLNLTVLFLIYDLKKIGEEEYKNNKEIQELVKKARYFIPPAVSFFKPKNTNYDEIYFSKVRPYKDIKQTYKNKYFQQEYNKRDVIKTGSVNLYHCLEGIPKRINIINDILQKVFKENTKEEQYFRKNFVFHSFKVNKFCISIDKDFHINSVFHKVPRGYKFIYYLTRYDYL